MSLRAFMIHPSAPWSRYPVLPSAHRAHPADRMLVAVATVVIVSMLGPVAHASAGCKHRAAPAPVSALVSFTVSFFLTLSSVFADQQFLSPSSGC